VGAADPTGEGEGNRLGQEGLHPGGPKIGTPHPPAQLLPGVSPGKFKLSSN